jgi:AraC-like DNA-binding protein
MLERTIHVGPPLGMVARLDMSHVANDGPLTVRTGPLGLQIAPMDDGIEDFVFRGMRIRGRRCVFSIGDVCGAELRRSAHPQADAAENTVSILVRVEAKGSVTDPSSHFLGAQMEVIGAGHEVCEVFPHYSHIATLYVQQAVLGIDHDVLDEMTDQTYSVTPMQSALLCSAVALLTESSGDELVRNVQAVDRYLASLAGLLLRTAVPLANEEPERLGAIRTRAEEVIHARAADVDLTPAVIADHMCVSLRQLYRAFDGSESPAARIRRRRLELAAAVLADGANVSVDAIATQCGFASAEYFSRAFRRHYGLSPRAYRSAHRDMTGKGSRTLVSVGARRSG